MIEDSSERDLIIAPGVVVSGATGNGRAARCGRAEARQSTSGRMSGR
jgi:hypothetical protein